MSFQILPTTIEYGPLKASALILLPSSQDEIQPSIGIFTHGYTSHKSNVFSWATKLMESGIPSIIFDLPGHKLGSFQEVQSFEDFIMNADQLFESAKQELLNHYQSEYPLNADYIGEEDFNIIYGGHSLGGLLALKALSKVSGPERYVGIGVGLGLPPKGITHVFESKFYESTMKVRKALVCDEIKPDLMFPWIKEEKEILEISGKEIALITGKDDVVVGDNGADRFSDDLTQKGNTVTLIAPTKLSHHQPELAAGHVKKYLKDIGII